MDHALIGKIAGVIAAVAYIPYIISILQGRTKPQRTSFAIWSVVTIVTFFSYIASGATDTIWTVAVYSVFQLVILALSFKYGMGGFNKLDIFCLAGAALGIILWMLTSNPHYALYLSVFSELLGWLPTFKKTYFQPKTEDGLAWGIALGAAALNMLAITDLRLDIVLYPLYIFLGDILMVLFIFIPRKRT